MHRTNLKGVNFSSSASKTCKPCIIGSWASIRHKAWMRIHARVETRCIALVCRCVCFCYSAYLSVCLAGNLTLPLRCRVFQMSGKTED